MVGAINVDFVVVAPRLPGPGETVVGPGLERHGGGKGANAAVAAARAGARVHLVAAVGADDTGRSALDQLRADGVTVDHVALLEAEPTGVALIVVDARGENQIAVGAGANAALTSEHVRAALGDLLSGAGCVLVSTEIPLAAVEAAVVAAHEAGVRCVLNPAPVHPGLATLLAHSPLLTPNRGELFDLARAAGIDGDDVAAVAAELSRRASAPVVVTLGGDGALVVSTTGAARAVAARPATVRDTTGAGDTFNGVLAARLAAGDELDAAVDVAVLAASLSVGHVGARAGMPTAAAIGDASADASPSG